MRQYFKNLKNPKRRNESENRECKAGTGSTHREVFVENSVRVDLSDNLEKKYETYSGDERTFKKKELFWARFSVVMIAIYAAITLLIYCANKESADAALKSIEIAQNSFRDDQRAWVGVSGKPELIKFSPDAFDLKINFLNTGKTPALRIKTISSFMTEWPFVPGVPKKQWEEIISKTKAEQPPNPTFPAWEHVLAPQGLNDYHYSEEGAQYDVRKHYNAVKVPTEIIYFYGALTYYDIYGRGPYLTTWCVYISRHETMGLGYCPEGNTMN